MDFRISLCQWCPNRGASLQICEPCPRYKKYTTGSETRLQAADFCDVCLRRHDDTLQVFCTRNRFYQEGGDEDFDCYQFRLEPGNKP